MSQLDAMLGTISKDNVEVELGNGLNFVGASVTVARNADTGKIDITITGGGGGGGGIAGPGFTVDDRIATWVGTGGDEIQDGGATISDVVGAAVLAVGTVPGAGGAPATVTLSGVAAASGASANYARQDHVHSLTGRLPFANFVAATAGDKLVGSTAAGSFVELGLTGGVERNGTNLQISSQLPARGGENVVVDVYPSTQTQGTLATAASVNFDIPIAAGKRVTTTWDVWVDDGAGGAVLYTKAITTKYHQTSGAAAEVSEVTISAPLEGAGFTFTVAPSTTNARGTLSNTSGSTRSYNIAIGSWSMDKP